MGLDYNGNKGFRLLSINERLNKGEILSKSALSLEYGVTQKTIQRDIDDLRTYLAETHFLKSEVAIKYDKARKGYYLVRFEREWLTNEEVLALSKILLESRAFCKTELDMLLSKLLTQVTPGSRKQVEMTICNEQFHYVPVKHNKNLLNSIWELSEYIATNELIEILYTRQDGISKIHDVKPVAIMFSEYYFYLIAFMADDSKDFPTVFRIDRIEKSKKLNEKFRIPYKDKFNEGEFRKRVQFMYTGPLKSNV
ncbi:helix-turn-helix transcriptional regulator [Anaerotignum sp.]|uniref:helix-turn-helix transcriptional regulator n=1 Tax=Anaerotignum sp. TaxID=2039241 RepID=UPI0028A20325|nr:WYL domain-containing protein [Anaerotignum sp.]